ncbi:TIR domain-containing protein [Streptomyces sp. NPDC048665]|uniref:toll/interleukin-1 receptor domain-containing protein n=1 Tax=Streptomyces sp. NPDC048665 TaxID=3155490 RepID=UPI003433DA3A
MSEADRRYDAFISYSTSPDAPLAIAVQRALHHLARPWYRMQALRVFRDQTSLAAGPDLRLSITEAIQGSEHFILLASPESAASPWVQHEVEVWRDCHQDRPTTFFIAVTAGEVHWDRAAGGFDWGRTTALPAEQLRGWFQGEPLWVDLSWARDEDQLSLRHPRFRDAVGSLAAAIHGRPKDELDGEDIRQHRRATWLRRAAAAILVMATAVAFQQREEAVGQRQTAERQRQTAVEQRHVADEQRRLADQQRALATGRALQAAAETLRNTQPQTSLRMSLAALRVNPTPEARKGLITTLMQTRFAGGSDGSGGRPGTEVKAAFSRDRRTLATVEGGSGDTVTLWDVSDPAQRSRLGTLRDPSESVEGLDFGSDGRILATVGSHGTTLWDIGNRARPRQLASLTGKGTTSGVAFSADGHLLATVGQPPVNVAHSDDGALALWDVQDPARPRRLSMHTGVYDSSTVIFSPDGHSLATSTDRMEGPSEPITAHPILTHIPGTTLWDISDRTRPQPMRRLDHVRGAVSFSPDSHVLATAYDQTLILWDVTRPGEARQLSVATGHSDRINAMRFSPDGSTLATVSDDHSAVLWRLTDGKLEKSVNLPGQDDLLALSFSEDGRTVVTADASDAVTRWRLKAPAQPHVLATLKGHNGKAMAAAFGPDGRDVVTTSYEGTIILWDRTDTTDPHQRAEWTVNYPVADAAISLSGRVLAAISNDGTIRIWDISGHGEPRLRKTMTSSTPTTSPGQYSILFSRRFGETLVAAGGDLWADQGGWAGVWNVDDPAIPRVLSRFTHTSTTEPVALSPDGKILALPGPSLWDIGHPAKPVELAPRLADADHYSNAGEVAFSRDGKTLATADSDPLDNDAVALWDMSSPAHPRELIRLNGTRRVNRVAFHPRVDLLAVAGADGTTRLWDVADPKLSVPVTALQTDPSAVNSVSFSPDGQLMATASGEVATVWALGELPSVVADPVGMACKLVGQGFSHQEWQHYAPGLPYQRLCPAGA